MGIQGAACRGLPRSPSLSLPGAPPLHSQVGPRPLVIYTKPVLYFTLREFPRDRVRDLILRIFFSLSHIVPMYYTHDVDRSDLVPAIHHFSRLSGSKVEPSAILPQSNMSFYMMYSVLHTVERTAIGAVWPARRILPVTMFVMSCPTSGVQSRPRPRGN